jgi:hypothetical protein
MALSPKQNATLLVHWEDIDSLFFNNSKEKAAEHVESVVPVHQDFLPLVRSLPFGTNPFSSKNLSFTHRGPTTH